MNNINKKNKIFSLSYNNDLPHKNESDVVIETNQIIYSSINNNLKKLVDNDLFIEKQLQKEQQYHIGPKNNVGNDISAQVNGFKMWNNNILFNVPISVLHKIDDELSSTISKTSIASSINFICDIGSKQLIGTTEGLYIIDEYGKISKDARFGSSNIKSYILDLNSNFIILLTNQTNKTIMLVDISNESSWTYYEKSNLTNIESLFLIDEQLYIDINNSGTHTIKVASLKYNEQKNNNLLHFENCKKDTTTLFQEKLISVNKFNNESYIVSDNGFYKNKVRCSFNELININKSSDITIKNIVVYNSEIYVSSNKGLYKINGNNLEKKIDGDVYSYFIYDNKLYLIVDTKLYKFDGSESISLCNFGESGKNSSIGVFRDYIIVAFPTKILWIKKDATNIGNKSSWTTININNSKNEQQIVRNDQILIPGKKTDNTNTLIKMGLGKKQEERYNINTKFGVNKVVFDNEKYICGTNGLYDENADKITISSPTDKECFNNGNIQDLLIHNGNWILISYYKDNYNLFYGKNVADFESYKKYTTEQFKKCCIANNILLLLTKDGKLKYDLNYDFSRNPVVKEVKNLSETVVQIESYNNDFYILTKSGKLFNLDLTYNMSISENDIPDKASGVTSDKLCGFNFTQSMLGKQSKTFFGENSNHIYEIIKIKSGDFVTDEDGNTIESYKNSFIDRGNIASLNDIKNISQYSYYYDTELSPIVTTTGPTINGLISTYHEISSIYSYTKDIYQILNGTTLYFYELSASDDGKITNWQKIKDAGGNDIKITDLQNVKGLYYVYDYKISLSNDCEPIDAIYSFIFQKDNIQYVNLNFSSSYEKWDNPPITTTGNKKTIHDTYEYCKVVYNKNTKNINKLKNLTHVTNVENLSNNMFLFVANNKIYYYLQDKNNNIISDFKNDRIFELPLNKTLTNITSIAAVCKSKETNEYINVAIKTGSKIYTCEFEYKDNLRFASDETLSWHESIVVGIDSNSFEVGILNNEIIGISNNNLKYYELTEIDNFSASVQQDTGISQIKHDTHKQDNFYKIKSDSAHIKTSDGTYVLNIKNIKNITYENNVYNIMGKTGISTITTLSEPTPVKQNVFESVPIVDVWNNFYGGQNSYYTKYNNIFDILEIKGTKQTNKLYTKLKYIDGVLTFISDDDNKLYMVNGDDSYSLVNFDTNDNEKIGVYRITDNLVVGDNKKVYDKETKNEIVTKLSGLTSDGVPKILDELNKHILISGNILNRYDAINDYKYIDQIISLKGIKHVYVFDDEKIVFTDADYLYYYYPETNSYYLKYATDSEIKNIKKLNNEFFITETNNLYTIDQNFRNNTKKYILSYKNMNCAEKITDYKYLLGCSNGLYQTAYSYKLINDIPLCSITNINDFIDTNYNNSITQHNNNYHNDNSTITKINDKKMPVDCSNLDHISNNTDIHNFIKTIEFGDNIQYISAYVTFDNELSVNNTNLSNISYIVKDYAYDDKCELLVYIPSTNTNYVNHIKDIKNDQSIVGEIFRKNMNVSSNRNLNDNKTTLCLKIDKNHFDFNRIISIEINGNSLPLNIYVDNDNKHLFKNINYSSLVKKSMLKTLGYKEKDNVFEIYFLIFGTDAQSIRLKTFKNIRELYT